jgi:hypothetical protein
MTDRDVLAVARSLLVRYGDEAKRHAYQRASELLEDGDLDGRDLWMQVADAIDEQLGAP